MNDIEVTKFETPPSGRIPLLVTVAFLGVVLCAIALHSIRKMTSIENSFRTIISWQMRADILKLVLTTGFCAIPPHWAPAEDATISKIVAACCETLYFFACDLHTLFAIHRFILVVAHSALPRWRLLTPAAICLCLCTGTVKAFYLMILDPNLYLRYDRRIMQWMFTDTPWTQFYKTSKIIWSSAENCLIITLDLISFVKLRGMIKMISNHSKSHSRADLKLVAQSLCQSIPTSLVVVFYFYIYPLMEDDLLMFATSTLMWTAATACDGFVVVVFHTRVKLLGWGSYISWTFGETQTHPLASPSAVGSKQYWTAPQELPDRRSSNPVL